MHWFWRAAIAAGAWVKWAGLVVCVLLFAQWAASLVWNIAWCDGRHGGFWLYRGAIWTHPFANAATGIFHQPSFDVVWWSDPSRNASFGATACLPMWIPLVIIAVPTVILWLRGSPLPDGHCSNCGYNLTGNVSGVCPECGAPVQGAKGGDGNGSASEAEP